MMPKYLLDTDSLSYVVSNRHPEVRKRFLDMLIAAAAKSVGAVLVTNNVRHFSKIDGLPIEDWVEKI